VPLVQQGSVSSDVGIYLNRLSDYLFTAARLAVSTVDHLMHVAIHLRKQC
jgi:cob(I)alamin adenosyltransferase